MPKLREPPQKVFYDELTKRIKANMVLYGYDRRKLAHRACINYQTLCKRIREPDTWILSELTEVMRILKIDFGEIYGKGI